MDNEFLAKLQKKAGEYGIALEEKKLRNIEDYKNMLLEWNKKVNLTRITQEDDFIEKHVIDSLIVTKLVKINSGAKIIDVGTGPGIPGFFLKIERPDIKLTLLEAVRKKTDFLMKFAEKIKLEDIEVINERAENIAKMKEYRETYDIAVARAVSSLNVLSELCLPFVKSGGIFVAMKGEKIEEEVQKARNSLDILGGKIREIKEYKIDDAIRKLLIIEKIKNTPEKYPRRPGMPEKNPL